MTEVLQSRVILAAGLVLCALFAASSQAQTLADNALPDPSLPAPTPPPISSHYLQYGVALTGEAVASPGQVCPRGSSGASGLPCILDDGGGLLVLTYAVDVWMVVLFVLAHGLAWGIRAPLQQSLRADYFGAASFGAILGFSSLLVMIGNSGGPVLEGFTVDQTVVSVGP